MLTKIFHPNISKQGEMRSSLLPFGKLTCVKWVRSGEICVDTLKKGWKREYGIGHVLVVSPILQFFLTPTVHAEA
jgi:ubiquitin-conjugating enzyme E2 S